MTKTKATKVLNQALELIESDSIRAWAQTPHNKPIFVEMISTKEATDPVRFAGLIVALAVGLI